MDENLRETTELPGSGGTAPNEGNEPETKSIRFVPSAYDPRGIEQWLSERAAEGKLLLRYDDFVIGEPRDCRYHLEPAADDDDPDESCCAKSVPAWAGSTSAGRRTASSISGAVKKPRMSQRRRTVRIPTATADCAKSCAAAIFCRWSILLMDVGAHLFLCFTRGVSQLLSLLTMPKNDVIQVCFALLLGSIIGMFSERAGEETRCARSSARWRTCEYVEQMPRNRWAGVRPRALRLLSLC